MSVKVLIVDDSPVTRMIIAKAMKMIDVPVELCEHAGNGVEALEKLAENSFDLCFVDINMPVMNGVELIEQMAQKGLMDSTAVITVSTEGSATRITGLAEMGVAEHIRKPFTPEEFDETVTRVVSERHAH